MIVPLTVDLQISAQVAFPLEPGFLKQANAPCVVWNTGCFDAVQLKPGEDIGNNQFKCGEHMALAGVLLAEQGMASARSELIFSHGRLCLESTRFDRIGAHGRRGVVSLAAWSDAYDGKRDNWPAAAARMYAQGWLNAKAVEQIEQLWWFGRLIGNTDMHFGNLSFFLDDAPPLTPCPSYDMLPMRYRPGSGGHLPDEVLDPPPYVPAAKVAWQNAARWAQLLWERIADHAQVSAAFRALAQANTQAIHRIRQRLG